MDWLINLFRRWPRPTPTPPAPPSPPSPQPTPNATDLFRVHNAERAKVNVPPLWLNGLLGSAAQAHADDMARTGVLDHQGSDGSQPWDRASRAGYRWSRIGENIARGQESVDEVMYGKDGWMNSPPHRANLLDARFRDVGFGLARGGDGRLYWCVLFGS